jgi:hypothetical protein
MKLLLHKFLIILIIIVFTIVPFSDKAYSVSGPEGLTISPPLKELDFEPGNTYDETIKLNNPTKNIIEVYPVARNFSASGENGVPSIESPDTNSTYGLATWISFSQSKIVLTPDQEVEFNYQIKVPSNAEPGGHYASVLFASQPPEISQESTQVALASMVGSLILGKVAGNVIEKAEIREFATNKKIIFTTKTPVDFTLRIANIGNVHIKPKGEILVSNWGKNITNIDINPQKGNILPNSTRKFDNLNYKTGFWSFGKFSATLSANYGDKNQPLSGQIDFYIIPWWLILVTVLIIISIIIFIIKRKRKNKTRKKNIISPPTPPAPERRRVILQ